MIIKVLSKFELKRLCKAVGATALTRLGSPTAEELGTADEVLVQEIGSQKVTVFKRETEDCKLSTIVLRGSTHNLLDDIERALDDGCNTFRCLIKNG
jgi:T-complex protein 1 subunit theta